MKLQWEKDWKQEIRERHGLLIQNGITPFSSMLTKWQKDKNLHKYTVALVILQWF